MRKSEKRILGGNVEGLFCLRQRVLKVMLMLIGLNTCVLLSGAAELPNVRDLDARLAKTATLGDLIVYAYQENPSVREVREAWRAVVENYQVVTGYPDPELAVTYFPEPIQTRLGPQDWNVSISQRIPFPGKLSKAGEVVEAEARIAKLKVDQAVRDMIVSIRESFFELHYIRKARQVADNNLKLLHHMRKVAETSFAREQGPLLDMVKSQSQIGQLRYDLLLLEDLERTEIARLNGLLNRHPDSVVGMLQKESARPVTLRLEEIYDLAATHQEELQIATVQVEKAKIQ
ncbi:MAG: TolC family protein, partial [Desulfobacterales bacterium]|nr:TolC family protein [Desulfobacterales bacterium]